MKTQSVIKEEILQIASDLREGYITTMHAVKELEELLSQIP